ncbi:MAG: type II secretion system protein GspF [Deltaproteobacteria bacterium]|nr:type II secretion system protein GspF [Deltaproteobacteria bacterium]
MPEYVYKASDRAGKTIEGSMDVADEAAVVAKLRGMGYLPIRIDQAAGAKKQIGKSLKFDFELPILINRVSAKDLLSFTQELSTLIKAGLPLDRALSILTEITDNEELKTVNHEILKDVRGGKAFSEALVRHPRIFNRLYVNMIKAGEAGGVLDVVLERLLDFLERSQELRGTIVNAMIYPALLISAMGIIVSILLIFVVPKFMGIFEMMGQEIPFTTRMLLGFSNMIKQFWWLFFGTAFGGWYWFQKFTKTESGKLKWDTFQLQLIIVKDLILKIEVARFSRTLGTLITSGVPLLQALNIVKEVVGNLVISNSIVTIQKAVKEGKGVSMPMRNANVFPSLAMHMVRVGEETGNLEEMLIRVADTYDREVQTAVKRFISVLEPGLILVMSVLVVCIILPIITAIFSINDVSF